MQTTTTADNFQARRSIYTRPTLGSEIVRPVFHRGLRGEGAIDSDDNYSDVTKPSTRAPSRETASVTKSMLPPITTAFISPSQTSSTSNPKRYYSTEPYIASRYSSKSFKDASDNALTMVANCASQQTNHTGVAEPQLKRKRVRLKTERRREQCRANQARYRQKQLNHAKTLEETVQKLRADIPVLELQRNRLLYGGQQNVWNVVVEYFHVFRFGVPVTLPVESEDGTIGPSERLENAETKHQLAFLHSSMTEDVILGERSGVETLMEQWRLYSSSFQSLYFQLERVERTNDKFVSVSAMLNVTVSEMTFRCVFPHLLDEGEREDAGEYEDDADSTKAYLRSKLLGRRLQIPCSLCFEWGGNATCRVVHLETTVNFMTPLMKVLGNLSDVALVMEHALITRDGAVSVRDLHN